MNRSRCKPPLLLAVGAASLAVLASPAVAAAAPVATTLGVSDVAPNAATLHGTVDPNGVVTKYYFEYRSASSTGRTKVGTTGASTAAVQISQRTRRLRPDTVYIYRLVAVNDSGRSVGDAKQFRTRTAVARRPAVVTVGARDIAPSGATLTGAINTRGATGTYFFEYGPTDSYGSTTPATPFGPTTRPTRITSPVGGLAAATRYHFRLVFQTQSGSVIRGSDRTFTTSREPNGLLIEVQPNPVRYGNGVQVAGILAGSGNSGVAITVQADTFPFDGNWQDVASGSTDATGAYTVGVSPLLSNTQVRTVAAVRPQVISQAATVGVRLRVSLRVRTRPHRGARVRFHGRVTPSQDGAAVSIQRRVRGHYRTIARTRVNGSSYSRRVKIRRTGRYRALVRPTDGSHISGKRSRFIRVR